MSDPAELFARLSMQLEDLHGLTVEGQRKDQPPEHLLCLSRQAREGLQRSLTLCAEIEEMCENSDV